MCRLKLPHYDFNTDSSEVSDQHPAHAADSGGEVPPAQAQRRLVGEGGDGVAFGSVISSVSASGVTGLRTFCLKGKIDARRQEGTK